MPRHNYTFVKQIGRGSFGTVDLVMCGDEKFCMKKVDVRAMTPKERDAAKLEADMLQKFDQPNVVQYKESFIEAGWLCIVMELARSGDLEKRLRKQRGQLLPEAKVVDWFRQICLAMQHIHGKNVLHRDLKSQNIFLTDNGTVVKVGDFGISRVMATGQLAKTRVGTPYYMSPEIMQGEEYNHKSDIWSLGCVLYELTTLRHPFTGSNLQDLARKISRGKYTPPPATYSPQLHSLIADMLSRDPAKRPDIEQILSRPILATSIPRMRTPSTPATPMRPQLTLSAPPPAAGQRPVGAAAAAAAAAAAPISPSINKQPAYVIPTAGLPSARACGGYGQHCAAPRRADGCLGERARRKNLAQQRAMAGVY
jgi:NIMA (never in mitosis gene a)-related kinase